MTENLTPVLESDVESDLNAPPGAPRWVKLFGIAAVVLILVFAGLHLTGNAPTNMHGSSDGEYGLRQSP